MQSRFLTKRLVLAIHRDQILSFGGAPGIRDANALDSALAQPQATFRRRLLHKTIAEQAAAYLFHIVANHPFNDGNKRVGLAVMDTFLRLNGYRLDMSDRDVYELVVRVASGDAPREDIVKNLEKWLAKD